MQDFEKLGVFYLGREVETGNGAGKLVLYDSRDLVTHAVCIGMTGSGKTGLCISLIEEAAIDGIPSVVIDPKGDLTNLLLTFPELRPADFRPWVNEDEARAKGKAADEFAAEQAELWRSGLAQWGEDGARIQRLRDAADFRIYTPASTAGIPVSILRSFAAPPADSIDDREWFRDRVTSTATSLLAVIGVEADPAQSREHILISAILDGAWRSDRDLDLSSLIQQIQSPPLPKLGVMDLESVFPAKDRFGLAMRFNNLLASPGFEAWLTGEALDMQQILYTGEGKPRVATFYIAHLSDTDRMFFVSLLLNQMIAWMRGQSGTTSLRALLYMDEIYGYLPPVSAPPSKQPMLTLLKQARAFGVGVVLATQNPVDLDYKALANAGTWFVGRLQTERDKARLLDGLEGAAAESGGPFNRTTIERTLSGLGSRVFLMNNVHEDHPVVFESRWTLSYLRGPLTRAQIKMLQPPVAPRAETEVSNKPQPAATAAPAGSATKTPVLPPDVRQMFLPATGENVAYAPVLVGAAEIRFTDTKTKVNVARDLVFSVPITNAVVPVDWDAAVALNIDVNELEATPSEGASFRELPPAASKARSYTAWTKDFTNWLAHSQKIVVLRSPSSGVVSNAGESERDFRVRLQHSAREDRDQCIESIRRNYQSKVQVLQDRLMRAQQSLEREQAQASEQRMSAVLAGGTALLDMFFGRKTFSAGNIGRMGTAARQASRIGKESGDVQRATETVQAIQQQLQDLNDQIAGECAQVQSRTDPMTEQLESIEIRPKKTNISVKLVCLGWKPE